MRRRELVVQFLFFFLAWLLSIRLFHFVHPIRWVDWRNIAIGTGCTFLKGLGGISHRYALGRARRNQDRTLSRLTRFLRLSSRSGSFPAPMLYPIALGFSRFLAQSTKARALLMLLGVQW